jgi:hypothetical protein
LGNQSGKIIGVAMFGEAEAIADALNPFGDEPDGKRQLPGKDRDRGESRRRRDLREG